MTQQMMLGTFLKTTLVDGSTYIFDLKFCPLPATVWVLPEAGDTIAVQVSFDDGVTFVDWANGDVTAFSTDVLTSGVTQISFERNAGSGTTSTCGVC